MLDPRPEVMLLTVEHLIIQILIEGIIKGRVLLHPHFLLFAPMATLMLDLPLCLSHRDPHLTRLVLLQFHNKTIYLADKKLSL